MINGVGRRCRGAACREVVSMTTTFCPKCVVDWQMSPERNRVELVAEPSRIHVAMREFIERKEKEATNASA